MCGVLERKENDFWELENLIYFYDTAIKNGQVYRWILKIKISMIFF